MEGTTLSISSCDVLLHFCLVVCIGSIFVAIIASFRYAILNGIDQLQDSISSHIRPQTPLDHVPQRPGDAPSLPVPDIRPTPRIGLAVHQPRRKLALELYGQRAQDRRVGARELAAVRRGRAGALGALADVLAADDEERALDVVYLDGPTPDAALVDQRGGACRTGDTVEDKRLRIPVQEAVLGGRARSRRRRGQREVRRRGGEPEGFHYGVQRRDVVTLRGPGCEGDEMRFESLLDAGSGARDGVGGR